MIRRVLSMLAGALLALIFVVGVGLSLAAEPEEELTVPSPEIKLRFMSFAIFKNDNDFDRSEPLYNANGQTVGYISTIFEPTFSWRPIDQVTLQYTIELGDNIWSRNDADERDPTADDIPLLKHKEFWAEVIFPGTGHGSREGLGLKTGYQYVYDPTHLFLDRYMGAAEFFYTWNRIRLSLVAGQIPDSVYEGISTEGPENELAKNNFEHDDYVFAFNSRAIYDELSFGTGLFFRWDKSEIGRPLGLLAPCFNLVYESRPVTVEFDIVGMAGQHKNAGLGNRDEDRLGGATQLGVAWTVAGGPVVFDWNLLAFTGDDGDRYDNYDSGFYYSGWSKSNTIMLTENWVRDQYDNLDERVAEQSAGMFVADQELSVFATESVRLMAIAGYGMVLDDTNTGDDRTIGTEVDLGVEWTPYQRHVSLLLMGGSLFPGGAGAKVTNEIDLDATDPVYLGQGAMRIVF